MQPLTADQIDIEQLNLELAPLGAEARIERILATFGDQIFLSTSFGIQSAVLLHLCSRLRPDLPVVWVDTGYLFPETYSFATQLTERLGLNLKIYTPKLTAAYQEAVYGKRWEEGKEGIEAYNLLNKVEPMNRAVVELGSIGWIAGLRRQQSSTRQGLDILVRQNKVIKVHPIIDWTSKDVYDYLMKHDLPYHPLWNEGYVTVGDWHSTTRLADAGSEEATRFGGIKRECGLHELTGGPDFQI
jgi:phosphoadenosine phosphosulfate reductase